MRDHLQRHIQTYIVFLLWGIVGWFSSPAAMGLVGLSMILFWRSERFLEMFMGFLLVLVFSDNLDHFTFAKSFKNLYIVFLAGVVLTGRHRFAPLPALHKGFLPFIIIAFIGLMYAGNVMVSLQKTISYLLLLVVVPSFISIIYREKGKEGLKDLAWLMIMITIFGILFRYVKPEFSYLGGRFRGLFGNPNGVGIFLFLSFAFFFVLQTIFPLLFSRNEKRFFFLVFAYALLICGSRTAILSVVLLLLFSRLYRFSPFIGFLILVGITLSLEYIFQNMVFLIQTFGLEEYFRLNTLEEGSGRFIAWGFAWQKIQEFFFIGGSMGNDEFIMRQNYGILARLGHQGGVHNSYLTLWFDVGVIGLVFYFTNFIRLFIQAAKKNRIAFPVLFATLFSITYESWLAGSLNPFTIVLFSIITILVVPEIVPETEEEPVEDLGTTPLPVS